LLAFQHAGDFGSAKPAIAFAKDEFGRTGAAVLSHVKGDDLGHRFGIAMDRPKSPGGLRLCGAAPAGADRIDEHQVGERQPSIWIIDQAYLGAITTIRTELGDARTDQPQIEKG
jgi:hypothetical protein